MYICLCNPFTDKDVMRHLDGVNQKVKTKDVYKACSGGSSMNCGTCACELKSMVNDHNNNITINALTKDMRKVADTEKEDA